MKDFFSTLYKDGEIINVRFISQNKEKNQVFNFFVEQSENTEKQIQELIKTYNTTHHAYFGVHPRKKNSTKNISSIRTFFVDIDSKIFENEEKYKEHISETLFQLEKNNLTPTIQINSGHGNHWYWILKPFENLKILEEKRQVCFFWTQIQKALQHFCKGDHLHYLPVILRLPGSQNIKDLNKIILCEIIKKNYEKTYLLKDFEFFQKFYEEAMLKEKEEKKATKIFQKVENTNDSEQFVKAVINTLENTPNICDKYSDFLRLAMSFKSINLSYVDIDNVFRQSNNYDQEKNEKIYNALEKNTITFGTAYYFAKTYNPTLLKKE